MWMMLQPTVPTAMVCGRRPSASITVPRMSAPLARPAPIARAVDTSRTVLAATAPPGRLPLHRPGPADRGRGQPLSDPVSDLAQLHRLVSAPESDAGLERPRWLSPACRRSTLLAESRPHWFWTIGTVMLEYAVGLPIALLLNRRSWVTGFLTGALLLPWVTPSIVVGYTWRWLLDSESGTIHAVLQLLGLAGERSLARRTESRPADPDRRSAPGRASPSWPSHYWPA